MSFLDDIQPEKRDMLVSLPYRVGLWVSQSDSSGGDAANTEELTALSNIISGYAEEVFGAETVQHIISETVRKKSEWPRWGASLGDVIADCRNAVDILSEVVDVKEVNAFRHHLVEIGEAVALAFREYDPNQSVVAKLPLYVTYYLGKMKALQNKKPYKSFDEFLNISANERRALTTLAQALDTPYI
jgi:hypothetical protein